MGGPVCVWGEEADLAVAVLQVEGHVDPPVQHIRHHIGNPLPPSLPGRSARSLMAVVCDGLTHPLVDEIWKVVMSPSARLSKLVTPRLGLLPESRHV